MKAEAIGHRCSPNVSLRASPRPTGLHFGLCAGMETLVRISSAFGVLPTLRVRELLGARNRECHFWATHSGAELALRLLRVETT